MNCADCSEGFLCREGRDCYDLKTRTQQAYIEEDIQRMSVAAATEGDFYMKATRLEEIKHFSSRMGYTRLGVAFCIGLAFEARRLLKVLKPDFQVFSTCCKIGGVDKELFGFQKMRPGELEVTCNPKMQAQILNEKETDLNLIVGLCIGHDLIFSQYSQAPVTTFIVKDRVLGHNPAAAIYSNYYRRKLTGPQEEKKEKNKEVCAE